MAEKFTIYSSADIDAYAGDADAPGDDFLEIPMASADGGLSDELVEAMSVSDTDDGVIMLLDIYHEDLTEAIRVTSSPTQALRLHPDTKEPIHGLIFNGKEYLWCPFSFIMGRDTDTGTITGISVSIQNVDPIMTEVLRNVHEAPRFDMTLLRKNNPTVAEMSLQILKLVNVRIDNTVIEGELSDYNYLAEPISPDKFTPGSTKGLF